MGKKTEDGSVQVSVPLEELKTWTAAMHELIEDYDLAMRMLYPDVSHPAMSRRFKRDSHSARKAYECCSIMKHYAGEDKG